MGLLNPTGGVDVPSSLFLGRNTEVNPIDLPEGCSPDCQDVVFVPGSVASRPGTHGILTNRLSGSPTFTYKKTYIQNDGTVLNLFLDSLGRLWKEDVFNNPGVQVQIGQVTPGSYATSVTANGREFIAFHDGAHGTDAPRQFDGTNFDRVSQDGVAAAVTVADLNLSVNITSITAPAILTIARISQAGLVNTVTTTTPHLLQQGSPISLTVAAGNSFNGLYAVASILSPTMFTVAAQATGLTEAAMGNVQSCIVTVVCAAPHKLQLPTDTVVVSGNANNNYNNGQQRTDAVGTTGENPAFWNIGQILSPTSFTMAVNVAVAGVSNNGSAQIGGTISVGLHQVCCAFLTRSGYITMPGPAVGWICGGNKQAVISNIPIGPANVVARILFFTGSGGSNFFGILDTVPNAAIATLINDNVTTTVNMDFADNTLFAQDPIDITGNNLFALLVLGPCLGFTFYSQRLMPWGERNKVQNLLNMGFEGGTLSASPTLPLGWTQDIAGGALIASPSDFGLGYQITGTGGAGNIGQLSQPAFMDQFNVAILNGNTQYSFRLWAITGAAAEPGNFVAELFSASSGSLATATFALNTFTNAFGKFYEAKFNALTPAVIPADTKLRVYATGQTNAHTVTIDELELIPTAAPFTDTIARASYAAPGGSLESFDANTGKLGAQSDTSPIRCFAVLRDILQISTANGLHSTRDNGVTEPNKWVVNEVSRAVGSVSSKSIDAGKFGTGDTGEEWIVICSYGGAYLHGGGPMFKISQEEQKTWDRINKAAFSTIWVKNDSTTRRIYFGLPLDNATAPNVIMVLDYRELDTDTQIANSPGIHISFTGKMIASDLARKWTPWNLAANTGEILQRPGGVQQFCIGAGNGQMPGQANGFGQMYFFDPNKLTDDDYGQIVPYWTSYFFINHEQEQAFQLGGYNKTFIYSAWYATGVGNFTITPYRQSLANPWNASAPRQLSQNVLQDFKVPLNIPAQRCAFKFSVAPLPNMTDVQFNLQKMIISLRRNYMAGV